MYSFNNTLMNALSMRVSFRTKWRIFFVKLGDTSAALSMTIDRFLISVSFWTEWRIFLFNKEILRLRSVWQTTFIISVSFWTAWRIFLKSRRDTSAALSMTNDIHYYSVVLNSVKNLLNISGDTYIAQIKLTRQFECCDQREQCIENLWKFRALHYFSIQFFVPQNHSKWRL